MEPYWESVERIIAESDVILEILDARAVGISRNEQLEKLIEKSGRPRIFVINKTDLVSRKDLEKDVDLLKQYGHGEVAYVSCKSRSTVKELLMKIKQMFAKYGKRVFTEGKHKKFREAKADIVVGIVGYPNVGKSSIINALSFKKKVQVSSKAGTTHGIHWIRANDQIKLIDTPGVIPLKKMDESNLGLIASKEPEKLKEPEVVAAKIVDMFMKKNKQRFENFYNLKIESTSPYEIIDEIALKKYHLKKGGTPDDLRTSTMIIRDWQQGKLKL